MVASLPQVYYALGAVKELADLEKDPSLLQEDGLKQYFMMLKYTVAPLGFLLWATFEAQAIQRIPAGKQPWTVDADLDKYGVWKRIAQNSLEQTLVTFLCAVSLMSMGGKVGDFEATRFAISHVYMYILGRIGFAIGYLKTVDAQPFPGIGRVPGLLIGGFWLNAAYFFLGVLFIFGVPNTAAVLYTLVIVLGLVVPMIIFWIIGSETAAEETDEEKPITSS